MGRIGLLLGALLPALMIAADNSSPPAKPPPPIFAGESLPEPPQQHAAWTPPANQLPEKLVSAATELFAEGLADPRGCEYREIEVVAGSVWGAAEVVKTHGWLLPAKSGGAQRFAVCWNGLVYPAVQSGGPADLSADIKSAVETDRTRFADQRKASPSPDFPFSRLPRAASEGDTVTVQNIYPMEALLLLRFGEAGLANALWSQWTAEMPKGTNNNDEILADPYRQLASDWAWSLFDRAICAHERADDRLALLDSQFLARVQPELEKTVAARGIKKPTVYDGTSPVPNPPYIGFLGPLPNLLADEQRRVKEPVVQHVLDDPKKYPDQTQRIAALIRDLEEVNAHQWGQPGGVDLAGDPVVAALEKEGDAAVEPLLDCLENDERLTRSVGFGRDFFPERDLFAVRDAASAALKLILKTNSFPNTPGLPTAGPKAAAEQVRAFWEKTKGLTVEERWYYTLADDQATPDQWQEAADRIVQPTNTDLRGMWVVTAPVKPGEVPPMRGESLREKTNPSVSALLAQRVVQLNRGGDGTALSLILGHWDPVSAAPVLEKQIRFCQGALNSSGDTRQTKSIALIYAALRRIGDPGWAREYAAWVRRQTLASVGDANAEVFAPIWQAPEDPDIAAAAEWIFNDADSPWNSMTSSKPPNIIEPNDLLGTPLIAVPAFQKHILRNLQNSDIMGSLTVTADGEMNVKIGSRETHYTGYLHIPPLPAPDFTTTLRGRDYYAWKLSDNAAFPAFEPYWPLEKRNEAIAQIAAFLRQYGPRLANQPTPDEAARGGGDSAVRLIFPRLDKPATADEVARGEAIFSITGETRAVPLDHLPVHARWTTLKDYPSVGFYFDPVTKQNVRTDYQQDVLIWQAEEVLENGQWRRYYGVVGPHGLAKVPAEEIEILKE